MTLRIASLMACAAMIVAVPAAAQEAEPEGDGEVNLESIDMLFGDRVVTGGEDADGDAAEEDAAVPDGDADGPGAEETELGNGTSVDGDATEEEREPTDLERALAAYEICASEAGTALAEQGFSPEQVGQEALLRCGGQRAAYVNAFYFSLLPRYPDTPEAQVRASADRLATQTDAAIARLVTREVAERPAEEISYPDDGGSAGEDDLPEDAGEGAE